MGLTFDRNHVRPANLFRVLRKLTSDGSISRRLIAEILNAAEAELHKVLDGRLMSAVSARTIEWAAQKHALWKDEDHRLGQLG